jgi:hypothetical protein
MGVIESAAVGLRRTWIMARACINMSTGAMSAESAISARTLSPRPRPPPQVRRAVRPRIIGIAPMSLGPMSSAMVAAKRYPSGEGRLVGLRRGREAAQLETSLAAVLALLHGPDDLDERA